MAPNPMTQDGAALTVHLVEYEALKGEQVARIVHRNSLIYATIAASVAAVVAVSQFGLPAVLLLPPVTLLLGWAYLADDAMVSDLGRYIRLDLSVQVETATGLRHPFGWEQHCRRLPGRTARKVVWLVVAWLVFIGPVVGSCIAYLAGSHGDGFGFWLDMTLVAEVLAGLALAVVFAARADLKDGHRG